MAEQETPENDQEELEELENKGGYLENEPVRRVRRLLVEAGYGDRVIELAETARTAQDAADSIGTELGSIVKSLVYKLGDTMVIALVAGDHQCLPENLPRALALDGHEAKRPDADAVKDVTGFSIGGVAPIGSATPLPMVIDRSLKRFETVYAAAGHPHCVFPVSMTELKRMTGGIVSYNIAAPIAESGEQT